MLNILLIVSFFIAIYFGVAREAVILVLPVIVILNILRMRKSQKMGEIPKDLEFLSKLRNERQAYFIGYLILTLVGIFWIFLALVTIVKHYNI